MNSRISFSTIMKLINIIFLIVLENFVLDCGMGIFGVSLLIYYVFYTIFFGSLQTGIAKMVSIRNNKGINGNAKRIVKPALFYVIITGFLILAFSVFALGSFAGKFLGMLYPVPVIQLLCVVLILTGIADVLCGYLNGNGSAMTANIINLLKCVLPVVFSLFVVRGFAGYGSKVSDLLKNSIAKDAYSAMGIAVVYLAVSVIVLLITIIFTIKSRLESGSEKSVGGIDGRRAVAGGFISVNGRLMLHNLFLVLALFGAVLFYIHGAGKAGIVMADVYKNIGIIFTKLILPFLLVYIIFQEYLNRERHRLHIDYRKDEIKICAIRSQYIIKNSFFMLIPPTIILSFLASPIVKVIYTGQDSLSANYLQTGGFILLVAGCAYALNSILRAFDKEVMVWAVQALALLVQMIFLFIAFSGNKGDSMMILYSFYVYFIIQIAAFIAVSLKVVRFDFLDILMKLGKYGVAGIVMMILFMILDKFIVMNIFLLFLSMFFGYLLYYLTLIALHGISKKDEAALKRTLNYYPVHFLRSRLRL